MLMLPEMLKLEFMRISKIESKVMLMMAALILLLSGFIIVKVTFPVMCVPLLLIDTTGLSPIDLITIGTA